ncbi:hypothetical protein FOZ63_010907, partial [Perkinsus olseni]
DSNVEYKCRVCGTGTTLCCRLCEQAYYCGEECQRLDWRRGHGVECKGLGTRRPSATGDERKNMPRSSTRASPGAAVPRTRPGSVMEHGDREAVRKAKADGRIPVKPPVVGIDQALLVLRYGLLQRFGSFRAAAEWFGHHYDGKMNLEEFKNTIAMMRPGDVPGRQSVLPPGVAPYELFGVMDSAGSGEIDLAALMQSYWEVEFRGAARDPSPETNERRNSVPGVRSNSTSLRRSHRTAAVLAFRNARYDDAIVNAKQALRD